MNQLGVMMLSSAALLMCSSRLCALSVTVAQQGPNNSSAIHTCDVVNWADSMGSNRAAYIVRADGVYNDDFVGGYITRFDYSNGQSNVVAREEGHNRISGLGLLINHAGSKNGYQSASSKSEGFNATNYMVFQGDHHAIWRLELDMYPFTGHSESGSVHAVVDYSFRTGDDYFMYAITYDCTGYDVSTFDNDCRAPYCYFDWDGTGDFFDGNSGFEYGTLRKFKVPALTNGIYSDWTYSTNDVNTVPYVWTWKNSPDTEIGYVQTERQSRHTGGSGNGYAMGEAGHKLPSAANPPPESWMLDYQMSLYDHTLQHGEYTENCMTWQTPYQSIHGGGGSSSPQYYNNYAVAVVLDPKTRGGVTHQLAEMELMVTSNAVLTAQAGRVVQNIADGVGCPTRTRSTPVGFDKRYKLWRASASASNSVALSLELSGGTLRNPTFVVEDYRGTNLPDEVRHNGLVLTNGVDCFLSLDTTRRMLYLTLNTTLSGSNAVTVSSSYDRSQETNLLNEAGFGRSLNGRIQPGSGALYWLVEGQVTRENWGSRDGDGYLMAFHNWSGTAFQAEMAQLLPGEAGTHYVLSGYVAADASYTNTQGDLVLQFLDAQESVIGGATSCVRGVGTSWTYYEVEAVAPIAAKWIKSGVVANGQGTSGSMKIDDMSLNILTGRVARLEPEEGCYTGVNPAWSTNTVVDYNRQVGWDHICFVDFAEFPQASYATLDDHIAQVGEAGGIYVATLEPHDAQGGLAGIDEADCTTFASWCASWNAQGVPIIVRFAHEMNGDWYDWGMRPQLYREAFRQLADAVHTITTNTAMLWAPNVAGDYPYGVYKDMSKATYTNEYGSLADWYLLDTDDDGYLSNSGVLQDDPYEPFYPGDQYVDWVGMTVYHWGSQWPWLYNAWPEARKLFDQITGAYNGFNGDNSWNPNFYATYAEGHDKPMMIPETSAFFRPADPAPPSGYEHYTNDERVIKQRWIEQVYNISGDTSNAYDVAEHFPRIKAINWFNQYKRETPASNDWVNWTVTSNVLVKTDYYAALNRTKNGKRYFLHADDVAGYVYSWNASLEGWTAGASPFTVSLSTNAPQHGRACVQIDYDDSASPYGVTVMSDLSAWQDARSWSNYDAIYVQARVPTNVAWASYRLIMQSAESNWDMLSNVPCPADGQWHQLVFPYDWTQHDASTWLNLYVQIDLPTGAVASVFLDGLQVQHDADADGLVDDVDADDDNDGMTDEYEETYLLNIRDPSDAEEDLDLDGFTNYEEYLADTDPRDPQSALMLKQAEWIGPSEWRLSWDGRSRVSYQLQMAPYATGTWSEVGGLLSPSTNGYVYQSCTSFASSGFYRLVIP